MHRGKSGFAYCDEGQGATVQRKTRLGYRKKTEMEWQQERRRNVTRDKSTDLEGVRRVGWGQASHCQSSTQYCVQS